VKVSTVVEDFGSDGDTSYSPKPDKPKENPMKFQLETSDLDFLEQISTCTSEGITYIDKHFNNVSYG